MKPVPTLIVAAVAAICLIATLGIVGPLEAIALLTIVCLLIWRGPAGLGGP